MSTIESAIHALIAARKSCAPSPAIELPDADAAYAVQRGVAAELGWFGDHGPRFWKSGGASRTGLHQHAPLPPAGVWPSPADARQWPFALRGIEAEIALRLAVDVDAARAATLDHHDVHALLDGLCVSIEIVDSRWVGALDAPLFTKLGDLQSHGALVLGAWQAYAPHDWMAQSCRVAIGTQTPRAFVGTHSMQDPTWVVPAWLRHATRDGALVQAGTVVTTGTWCGILPAQAGDAVRVEFEGIGDAVVQL